MAELVVIGVIWVMSAIAAQFLVRWLFAYKGLPWKTRDTFIGLILGFAGPVMLMAVAWTLCDEPLPKKAE